ncbi:TRAP-type C4-dicarboxylate transport system, small permease component [Moorella thermoacetica Y72]|uniref:TRAP-type C4-dicarboxylate transport system, small permease component n=1 Tax=Moorella thermoacetica Y72 TaxID=1325331 RepID=A0A0S6UFI4_NEOTH|nr:TRAP-type C4-dicarboxylate transport system, small permease component [Moorella thermoacetica Y72]
MPTTAQIFNAKAPDFAGALQIYIMYRAKQWIPEMAEKSSFPHLDMDLAPAGSIEFAKINTLPGTQNQAALMDNYRLVTTHEGSLDMGRRITFPVTVTASRDDSRQGRKDIGHHIRVGVFINSYPGRGMGYINQAEALFDARLLYRLCGQVGNINHRLFSLGLKIKGKKHFTGLHYSRQPPPPRSPPVHL